MDAAGVDLPLIERVESLRTQLQDLHRILRRISAQLSSEEEENSSDARKVREAVHVLSQLHVEMRSASRGIESDLLQTLSQCLPSYILQMRKLEAHIRRLNDDTATAGAPSAAHAVSIPASTCSQSDPWKDFDKMIAHLAITLEDMGSHQYIASPVGLVVSTGTQLPIPLGNLRRKRVVQSGSTFRTAQFLSEDVPSITGETSGEGPSTAPRADITSHRAQDRRPHDSNELQHDHIPETGTTHLQCGSQVLSDPEISPVPNSTSENGKGPVPPCYIFGLFMFLIISASASLGIYYTVRFDKMGDGFTAASWVIAVGAFVLAGPFTRHYPACTCWRTTGRGRMRP